MDVSIILVNYNTAELTLAAIRSVYEHTSSVLFEIIVVDNSSTDNSVEMIAREFPQVVVLVNDRNIGFGPANNLGMEIASGKYFFLLNTDTYLLNNAVGMFFHFLERHPNAAVVGGTLLTPNGGWNVSAANFPSFRNFVKGSFWKLIYPNKFLPDEGVTKPILASECEPYEVDYVSGADFFIRRSVIDEVGKFDPRFFMYFEETELSLRIRRRIPHAKSYILPNVRIVHIGQGSSLDKGSFRFKKQYLKSRVLYFQIQNGRLAALMVYISGYIRILKAQ